MKHFVYFDKDFIDSYLSQIDGGLVTSLQEEINDMLEQGQIEAITPEYMDRKVGFSLAELFSLRFAITDEVLTTSNSTNQTQIAKELVNKVVHDDAYDKLLEDLKNKDILKECANSEGLVSGDYVYINSSVNIIDLSHIVDVYNDDFSDIHAEITRKELEESLSKLNREQRRSKGKSNSDINKEIEKELEDIEFGVKVMRFMAKMLPSDIFIMHENLLIPLNRSYFREDSSSIKFKYTEKISILGRLTGDLKDVLAEEEHGILTDVLNSLNELTLSMLGMVAPDKDLKILYPISLYFE